MNRSPWKGSTRKERLPSNWRSLRKKVLVRDGHRCRLCGKEATEVDHIIAGDDHRLSNLQAICNDCHRVKSSREGNYAPNRTRLLRKRPKENHPGLRKASK